MDELLTQLRLVGEITEKINRGSNFEAIFQGLQDELSSIIPAHRIAIGFLHPDGKTLILGPVKSDGKILLATGYKEPLDGTSLRPLIERGETRILADLEAYLARKPNSRATACLVQEGMRSSLTVPLVMGGKPLGVLWFSSRQKNAYRPEHETFMRLIAGQLAILMEKGRLLSRLQADQRSLAEARQLKVRLEDENWELREAISGPLQHELIGTSPPWLKTLQKVELVAAAAATVLIRGETGTGKELIARAIHRLSPRREQPFVALNCGALAPELIASELFGHEQGAFTGALRRKLGRIELAAHGTLFLDEVGDLPGALQVQLLRVLQEREFERVGGTQTLKADVRVIAATNQDLERARTAGRFRDDLYFRLNVFPLRVPPLRERKEDLEPLLLHFLRRYAAKSKKVFHGVERRSIEQCWNYHWPGNVRELENLVERAVILCRGPLLSFDPLLEAGAEAPSSARGQALDEIINAHLALVLRQTKGKIYGLSGAARLLGLKPSTLQAKLKKYGLQRKEFSGGS